MSRKILVYPDSLKEKYTGAIEVTVLPADEHQELLIDNGIYDMDANAGRTENAKLLLKAFKFAKAKGIFAVKDVKRVSDDVVISTFEDLLYESVPALPIELGTMVIEGFGPGNEKKQALG
jgi:hypothetical protein